LESPLEHGLLHQLAVGLSVLGTEVLGCYGLPLGYDPERTADPLGGEVGLGTAEVVEEDGRRLVH
jgi:hypothetical protein